MPGLEKILRGVLRYQKNTKESILEQLQAYKANPQALGMLFGCMDCRVQPTRYVDCKAGDLFMVRNPGNFIPHYRSYQGLDCTNGESAALELACVKSSIRHVIVCGHSDCRAMATLMGLKGQCLHDAGTPLEIWLKKQGYDTLQKFSQLNEENKFHGPLKFESAGPDHDFDALIDPEDALSELDKLSQVNCLQQISNISSYPFVKDRILYNRLVLHALWFDLNNGELHMFSRKHQRFIIVNESTIEHLVEQGKKVPAT